MRFLLTLLDHLEQKISAIREGRDLGKMSLEVLYGILQTYELEMMQIKSVKAGQGKMVKLSKTLISQEPMMVTIPTHSHLRIEEVVHEQEELDATNVGNEDFYTLEEFDDLDKSMAYMARSSPT